MFKYLIILILITTSCASNKVVKVHGTNQIDIKSKKLFINKTNKNDIMELLGPPSVISTFDNNTWIYLERKEVSSTIFKLGNKKLIKNNVLVVKLNNSGILENKDFFDLNKMNSLDFNENITLSRYQKDSFVYNLLTSLREKINNPVTKKRSSR
tara:strand:- start:193 stop:654 length:462 start_codon:yes stop_codon:yes gene_type:complete